MLTAEELMNALKQHAGYSTAGGQMVREKGQQQKFAGWQKCSPAVVLSKIVLCMSARLSNNIFARIRKSTLYTGLATGEYFPGPAESVSIALVDGISPSDFRNRVRTELAYVEGWKKQPNACLLYTSPSPRDQRGSRMPSSA